MSRTENDSVNWLKTLNSPLSAGRLDGQRDAGQGVADIQHAAGLSAGAVHGERMTQ